MKIFTEFFKNDKFRNSFILIVLYKCTRKKIQGFRILEWKKQDGLMNILGYPGDAGRQNTVIHHHSVRILLVQEKMTNLRIPEQQFCNEFILFVVFSEICLMVGKYKVQCGQCGVLSCYPEMMAQIRLVTPQIH